MTDLTFVTSNQTKLAHARYLCRDYHVNILSYKKFYYGIGYDEPRIFDRKQLLTASFYDAAARWKRNVSGSEERIFFIEDTSMRLDALSDDKNEIAIAFNSLNTVISRWEFSTQLPISKLTLDFFCIET